MLDHVEAVLKAADIHARRNEDPPVLVFSFDGDGQTWPVMILANAKAQSFVVYSRSPVRCPPDRLPEMYDFLHRCNRGFPRGAFEIDGKDGEIRFRVGLDTRYATLSEEAIKANIRLNVSLFQHGLRGILAVATGGMSADEAIRMLESKPT